MSYLEAMRKSQLYRLPFFLLLLWMEEIPLMTGSVIAYCSVSEFNKVPENYESYGKAPKSSGVEQDSPGADDGGGSGEGENKSPSGVKQDSSGLDNTNASREAVTKQLSDSTGNSSDTDKENGKAATAGQKQDVPIDTRFNHWLFWNIPILTAINFILNIVLLAILAYLLRKMQKHFKHSGSDQENAVPNPGGRC